MNLLDLYKTKNTNQNWFDSHSSLARGSHGRLFEYTNTNFRKIDSFRTQFTEFLQVEDKPREVWEKQESHGQEKDKHRVVNILQSKLFTKDPEGIFKKTAKGELYESYIQKFEKGTEESWLLNYFFLLNGYFFNRKNYIINRVKEDLLNSFSSLEGLTKEALINEIILLLRKSNLSEALRSNFFYIHSFYDDSDFLINFLRSSGPEKEELASYIESNLDLKNYQCCISKKYQPGGNFNFSMLVDESKVLLLTLKYIFNTTVDVNNVSILFIDSFYSNISKIDRGLVHNFIVENTNIFDAIFIEVLELEEQENETTEDSNVEDSSRVPLETQDLQEDYIDETTLEGRRRIKEKFRRMKIQARLLSNYTCALERFNNCTNVYFTAKQTNRNYVEVHHLLPQEFRNDFSFSIEVLANYITLCPRCHKQIHLALDRERKPLITALHNDRKVRLETVGLPITIDQLFAYYKVST